MAFIEELKVANRELTAFIKFIKPEVSDLTTFVKSNFKMQLGYYIDYISHRNLFMSITPNGYRFFYNGKIVKRRTIKNIKIIDICKVAVIDAFKYLENPF